MLGQKSGNDPITDGQCPQKKWRGYIYVGKLWKTDFFRIREGQAWWDDVKAKLCKSRQRLKRSVAREKVAGQVRNRSALVGNRSTLLGKLISSELLHHELKLQS